jgi:gibberellin 2-oxidase
MVVLAKGELEQIALPAVEPPPADVRSVDLSAPSGPAREAAARALVAACEEHGFFRVTGHGVPAELVRAAEAAAAGFFARPQGEKDAEAPTLGYGSKRIGGNGDLGWVEYLLLGVTPAAASASSLTLPCAAAAAAAEASASSPSAPAGPLR